MLRDERAGFTRSTDLKTKSRPGTTIHLLASAHHRTAFFLRTSWSYLHPRSRGFAPSTVLANRKVTIRSGVQVASWRKLDVRRLPVNPTATRAGRPVTPGSADRTARVVSIGLALRQLAAEFAARPTAAAPSAAAEEESTLPVLAPPTHTPAETQAYGCAEALATFLG